MDPSLGPYPTAAELRPTRIFRLVPVARRDDELPPIEATREAEVPPSAFGHVGLALRRAVLGPPLSSTALVHERMRKLVALPVLSADALSSVAYGPEAMLAVLALAGSRRAQALPADLGGDRRASCSRSACPTARRSAPIPTAAARTSSPPRTSARIPGLVAAAGLMIDYVLDLAVSVSAGVAAIDSAIPALRPTRCRSVSVIGMLLAGNLRGVREAGAMFSAPTYAFILAIFV